MFSTPAAARACASLPSGLPLAPLATTAALAGVDVFGVGCFRCFSRGPAYLLPSAALASRLSPAPAPACHRLETGSKLFGGGLFRTGPACRLAGRFRGLRRRLFGRSLRIRTDPWPAPWQIFASWIWVALLRRRASRAPCVRNFFSARASPVAWILLLALLLEALSLQEASVRERPLRAGAPSPHAAPSCRRSRGRIPSPSLRRCRRRVSSSPPPCPAFWNSPSTCSLA